MQLDLIARRRTSPLSKREMFHEMLHNPYREALLLSGNQQHLREYAVHTKSEAVKKALQRFP